MGSRERTLLVLGPSGAGKATTIGCMLFKYGAIDMMTMDMFQQERINSYDQVTKRLRRDGIAPAFDTPKYHVTILDATSTTTTTRADCAILVLAADIPLNEGILNDYLNVARKLVVVVNKMDTIRWSEEQFLKIVEGLGDGIENVPIVPISARYGDNVVEISTSSDWFKGPPHIGRTVLEVLDLSLQS